MRLFSEAKHASSRTVTREEEEEESASFLLSENSSSNSGPLKKNFQSNPIHKFPAPLLRDVFCIDTNGKNDESADSADENNQSDDEKSRSDGEPKRGPVRHARGPVDGLTRLVRDAIAAQERFHETNVETHRRNSE